MPGKEHDNPALPLLALPNRLMTIPEVAAYLNVPVRWIEDDVQRRRVRHTRIGKHVRVAPEHVAELIAAGEQPITVPRSCTPRFPCTTAAVRVCDSLRPSMCRPASASHELAPTPKR
jgi:excisionase family DNA binding protein